MSAFSSETNPWTQLPRSLTALLLALVLLNQSAAAAQPPDLTVVLHPDESVSPRTTHPQPEEGSPVPAPAQTTPAPQPARKKHRLRTIVIILAAASLGAILLASLDK